jgi:hypothetical protein
MVIQSQIAKFMNLNKIPLGKCLFVPSGPEPQAVT